MSGRTQCRTENRPHPVVSRRLQSEDSGIRRTPVVTYGKNLTTRSGKPQVRRISVDSSQEDETPRRTQNYYYYQYHCRRRRLIGTS